MPKKGPVERAPVAIWRDCYLPYFGEQGLFWAYFLGAGEISILRGFPDKGWGNGGQIGGILVVLISASRGTDDVCVSLFYYTLSG